MLLYRPDNILPVNLSGTVTKVNRRCPFSTRKWWFSLISHEIIFRKHLNEMVLMKTHNIIFFLEIMKKTCPCVRINEWGFVSSHS